MSAVRVSFGIDLVERAWRVLLILPVFLPLVIGAEVVYPYLVPKTLLFYAASLTLVAAFVVRAAFGRPFYWARLARPSAWAPGLLLALAYVTSLVGVDFYRSFWSLLIRGDGLLMMTGAVAYFYAILLSADRAFFARLVRMVALVGTLAAIYGIGEWLFVGGRIGSLLGNAAFFSDYLVLSFFTTLIAGEMTPRWKRLARVATGLQVLAVFLTATRGSIVALIAVVLVMLAYVSLYGTGKRRIQSRAALAGVLVLAGLFFVFRAPLSHSPITPIARLASIGMSDPDVASRLFIWQHMVGEIGKRPLTGVGAEHIAMLFDHFYDPTLIQEEWFDRSHNAYLDYAAQFGVLGALLYLSLIAAFFLAARAFIRRGETNTGRLLALLAVAYAVQQFFVFDTISSFWLVLALLAAALGGAAEEGRAESAAFPPLARMLSVPAAAILVVLIIPVSIRPAQAAYDLAQAYKYQLTDPAREASYLSRGMALGTFADVEYGYVVYDMYTNQAANLSGEPRLTGYQTAKNILEQNFRRYPYDARTALYYAHVLALAPAEVEADSAELSAALTSVLDKSPKRSQAWYILSNLSLSRANSYPVGTEGRKAGYEATKDILTKYIALVPTLSMPHFVLAQLEYANDDRNAAAAEASLGRASYKSDLETARRALEYYERVQDLPNMDFFLTEIVRMAPADYASLYDLAKVKYLMGDKAAAEDIVKRLRAENPAIIQSDPAFEAAITSYENSR